MTSALITGASRGLGRALAFTLADRGFELFLLGRPSMAFSAVEQELLGRGASVTLVPCDLARRAEVEQAAKTVLAAGGAPDVLIHNAAFISRGSVQELDDESWDLQMEVNLSAPFRLTRALLPEMLERGSGRILFVSSISAVVGTARSAPYNASKAGLSALMRCLAEEISGSGVSTMALLPGSVDTDMLSGSGFPPRMTAEEVAETLAFYATHASAGHNGACVEMFGI